MTVKSFKVQALGTVGLGWIQTLEHRISGLYYKKLWLYMTPLEFSVSDVTSCDLHYKHIAIVNGACRIIDE